MSNIVTEDRMELEKLALKVFSDPDLLEVERLGGMTNHTYAVTLRSGKYIFRLPGKGTEVLINREHERISTELAANLGIDAPLIYIDAKSGVKICTYIQGAVTMSADTLKESRNVRDAAKLFHILHTCGTDTRVPFEVFEMAAGYEKIIADNNVAFYEDYPQIRQEVMTIKKEVDRLSIPKAPCHNDPLCENWIRNDERMYLIDWEYAGMNDPMWDLADLSIESGYDKELDCELLDAYLSRTPTDEELLRFEANKIYLDFLWSLWGKTRAPYDGEVMEQYALDRYIRLKQNLKVLVH